MHMRSTGTFLIAALAAGAALADHPGAMWSVDRLEVSGPEAADIRGALTAANDIYFYGERAVRMQVTVGADALTLTVRDAASGAALIEGAPLPRSTDAAAIKQAALDWMDGLNCDALDCTGSGSTMLAAAPKTLPSAAPQVAKGRTVATPAWPQRVTGLIDDLEAQATTPMPVARPGSTAGTSLAGLHSAQFARTPDDQLRGLAAPIRIARLDGAGVGPISYSANDKLVLSTPISRAPATQDLPRPTAAAQENTALDRLFGQVARFLGFTPTAQPVATAATPRRVSPAVANPTVVNPAVAKPGAVQPSAVQPNTVQPLAVQPKPDTRLAAVSATAPVPSGTLLRPRDRWRPGGIAAVSPPAVTPTQQPLLRATPQVGERTALARPQADPQPALVTTPTGRTLIGLRRVPSPGLGLPKRQEDAASAPVVTPIRVASAAGAQQSATPRNGLAVKLHPEIFGKYSSAAAQKLFSSYGQQKTTVRLVTGAPGKPGPSVNRILSSRGLALDSDRFAKAERIFWSGESGSRGFWISLPRVAPSSFVLVASPKASVIANVYARGSAVQVSDAVAKALGLAPGDWSDVQIIALRQLDRTAQAATPSVTR